jgi:ELWxxDGT repeat protein
MRTVIAALLLVLCLPAGAQTPYLVKDINSTTNGFASSSSPANFFRFGSRIFFSATTAAHGAELWATDGTASGTAEVADIFTGQFSSSPSQFAIVNGKLLFNARSTHGEELWTTDGTSAGTREMADIYSGTGSSSPGDRIVYKNQLFFSAQDGGTTGRELWVTDGTQAGTRLFKDLAPGADSSNPGGFVLLNGLVYFSASGSLWKTDGIEAGTVQVTSSSVFVSGLTVSGSHIFFSGYSQQAGLEPWISDGTEAGTHLIREITSGATGSVVGAITAFRGGILFAADDQVYGSELWFSDGTAAGTRMVRDVNPGASPSMSNPSITVAGDIAYFPATTAAAGSELWKTDGTEGGTTIVRDIAPGAESSNPTSAIAAGNSVFFVVLNGTDRILWITDGSEAGTRPVKTSGTLTLLQPSALVFGVQPSFLTAIDAIVYFAGANAMNGYEPWKSDGTDAGTAMIANLTLDSAPSSSPRNLIAAGDWLYFDAWDGSGKITQSGSERSLWRTDGTPEGTLKLTDAPQGGFASIGHSLFFNKDVIWTSDGTPEGTVPADDITRRFPGPSFVRFAFGSNLYASVYNGSNREWATPTVPNATVTRLGFSESDGFVNLAGRLVFFFGRSLWTTDGTADGTYAIVPDLGESVTSSAAVMGGYVYFATGSSDGSAKLWKSEGTFDGTVVVKPLPATPSMFTATGRKLFFVASGQLWITDATDAGTRALPATPAAGTLTAVRDGVVFRATDSVNGAEPWGSDGTAEGTHLLRDIRTGAIGSNPAILTPVDGVAYFAALDDSHGSATWVTDGTSAGTNLVAAFDGALAGNFPQRYVRAGDRLYYDGTTVATGTELWALPLPATSRLTIDDIRIAEGDSGSKTARFTVSLSKAPAKNVTVDYATSDGTALAGNDYDAASGKLTFAPGETSKNIDVAVRGDIAAENNETFFVTLSNAAGAEIAKSTGFTLIDDDDQTADLALSLIFSSTFPTVTINAANNGPRTATGLKLVTTATPGNAPPCCAAPLLQLASGKTAPELTAGWTTSQQYFSATATAHERDPQPSNNRVGWIAHDQMAMDALYLTPGGQANVTFFSSNPATYVVQSSDPAVISVPTSLTTPSPRGSASFVAHALSAGTATITVYTSATVLGSLTVDVVAPSATPRWPGAINVSVAESTVRLDAQATVTVDTSGTAPFSGATATGLVTVTTNGQELGRTTLTPTLRHWSLPVSFGQLGTQAISVNYAGDANFLPSTTSSNVAVTMGSVTMLAGAERGGTTVTVHVRVTGSTLATPSGSIDVSELGTTIHATANLVSVAPGVSDAAFTLANISGAQHTFRVVYSGDGKYSSNVQSVRLLEARGRAVRH